ncbi:MAG: hypothetical protein H6944_09835 [Zoogloeaceae bacterium]|nr:hypothetical protein [Zoogloeaceae bacterium]HPR07472.1 hypothetical protein [Denitromonas sp.]
MPMSPALLGRVKPADEIVRTALIFLTAIMQFAARVLSLVFLFLATNVSPLAMAGPESILVVSAVEDAEGATQSDFTLPMLKALEGRTVELFVSKTEEALQAQGSVAKLPKLRVNSHYVEARGLRLAVVRIRGGQGINNVSLYGIVGRELRRVVCVRTAEYEKSIPLFYGPCGQMIKKVYGVEIQPS